MRAGRLYVISLGYLHVFRRVDPKMGIIGDKQPGLVGCELSLEHYYSLINSYCCNAGGGGGTVTAEMFDCNSASASGCNASCH